jgi:hypothetical protein
MWLRMRDIEKEGIGSVSVDEVHSLGRQPGRHHFLVVFIGSSKPIIPGKERKRWEMFRSRVLRPHIVGVGNSKIFVKAVL